MKELYKGLDVESLIWLFNKSKRIKNGLVIGDSDVWAELAFRNVVESMNSHQNNH